MGFYLVFGFSWWVAEHFCCVILFGEWVYFFGCLLLSMRLKFYQFMLMVLLIWWNVWPAQDWIQDIISLRLCTVNCAERLHRWWCYRSYAKYACWRAIVLGWRLINLTEIMNSGWWRLAHWCFVKKRVLTPGRMDQMLVIISMRLKDDLNCRSVCLDPHCSVDFFLLFNLIEINWR